MTSLTTSRETVRSGDVRDAIIATLAQAREIGLTTGEIQEGVNAILGRAISPSSVRSSLRLNVGTTIVRVNRGMYALASRVASLEAPAFTYGKATLFHDDSLEWLARREPNSIHAVVTDPPYGAAEYSAREQSKLRRGQGGLWRIPPTLDGSTRSPLPRFTTMTPEDYQTISDFFTEWAQLVNRVLVPGGNVLVAANPLVSYVVSAALTAGGLERRGEVIRLVQTLRGGDRPKGAHEEFSDVSVMPRSQWEPWLLYRKPIEGTVAENLRKWGTGGFRRISDEQPFGDVIKGPPARGKERAIAPHPSLKPQGFLRRVVRASLPTGQGIVLDPFAGSGSTLAAAEAVGYSSIGVERDPEYINISREAIPRLSEMTIRLEED
ncbi:MULTISPECIES: DNA-methyltransferase [Micrococcales]|jgi:DNA modification methylase|uniref:DNA-methyltransferase n=1 Tax=Micrococcales TaxID=85006 RepID=UPI001E33F978|nr:DNA methyltransferase [Brevibacterium yomogidense]